MYQLGALAVSGHNDLGVGAVGDGLRHQVGHELGPLGVAALEEAGDVGGVLDALDEQVVGADLVGHGLEKGRARDGAHVARLGGAAGKDDDVVGAAAAVDEAVLLVAPEVVVLAGREEPVLTDARCECRGGGEGGASQGEEEYLVHHFLYVCCGG